MATLYITDVLLVYEEPLVVVASDARNRVYLGINYGDGTTAYKFYFARLTQDSLDKVRQGRVDVRYGVTRLRQGGFAFGECWGASNEHVTTAERAASLPESMLPAEGMFIHDALIASTTHKIQQVKIDGRWGIDDLRNFSDLLQDAYSFVFSLTGRGTASTRQKIAELFHRYPWRGGYSSINFFNALYKTLPNDERADISSIQYASPGTIELRMNSAVAASLRGLVDEVRRPDSTASLAYEEVRDWLQVKGWLGRADVDLQLTASDRRELENQLVTLCTALHLANRSAEVLRLASHDQLAAVKILLAYYRRLAGLAEYVETGKARDLFG